MRRHHQQLLDVASTSSPTERGSVRTQCPMCPVRAHVVDYKSSLRLNVKTGWYRCYRCAWRGRLPGYEAFHEEPAEVPPDTWVPAYSFEEPSSYFEITDKSALLQPARDYLKKRGVSRNTAVEARIGYALSGVHRGRLIIPVLDFDGAWMGWIGRHIGSSPLRYYAEGRDFQVYNERALLTPSDVPVLLVEGVFDALPYWPHAVAALGKDVSPTKLDFIAKAKRPVIVAWDGDSWREGKRLAAQLELRGVSAYWVRLPGGHDPCDTDHKSLLQFIKPITPRIEPLPHEQ